jgi:hypothetical protein
VGRQILQTDLAYIAGFLDGDGSIIVQIKKVADRTVGWRLMFTICFYQDTRHEKPLFWIKKKLRIGYISRRKDRITELRINGYKQVKNILEGICPYVKFKEKQTKCILKILEILEKKKSLRKLDKKDRIKIANAVIRTREENYQSGKKKMEKLRSDLEKIINLSP